MRLGGKANRKHVCFRTGQAWGPLRVGQEGGDQNHQQGKAVRVCVDESGTGDRDYETDRPSSRSRSLGRIREQEISVSI